MNFSQSKQILFLFISLFISMSASAHGEDKPGPHGGNIRMPGLYHIEVLKVSELNFKIYFLDMNWKNPTVKKSKLAVSIQQEKSIVAADCKAKEDFFLCEFPKSQNTEKGKLIVRSERDDQRGAPMDYELPLKFDGSEKTQAPESHKGHH